MTLASNIAAAWTNIALNATLTASSEAANMLVTKLQQEDTKRNWRTGAATTAYVLATFSANQSADTFFLANTNLTAAGIARVRLSSVDATGAAGDIYDSNSGGAAGQVDPNYKDLVVLASSVKSGWKYCRIDLTDTSRTYIEAGFLFIGLRTQFDYTYSYGAGRTRIDPSIPKKTKGGQTKLMIRPPYWDWKIPMGWITAAQANGAIEQINLLNGRTLPVLFLMNPASTNLGKDSIFGLMPELSAVEVIRVYAAGSLMSSTSFHVEQRL